MIQESAAFCAKESLVRDLFAVDYSALELSEKKFVWYCFIRRSTIEVIEEMKGVPLNEFLGDQKMQEKDALFKKCLTLAKMDVPSSKRFFLGSKYKTPITFQMLAIGGELMGVAVKTYVSSTCCETQGMFLVPLNPMENIQIKKLLQTKKRSHFNLADYKDKYGLLPLLETGGFCHLARTLLSVESGDTPSFNLPLRSAQFGVQMVPLDMFLDSLELVSKGSRSLGS